MIGDNSNLTISNDNHSQPIEWESIYQFLDLLVWIPTSLMAILIEMINGNNDMIDDCQRISPYDKLSAHSLLLSSKASPDHYTSFTFAAKWNRLLTFHSIFLSTRLTDTIVVWMTVCRILSEYGHLFALISKLLCWLNTEYLCQFLDATMAI